MNLREALRSETKAAHQKLDDFVGQMKIFDSAENYRAFLLGMNRLYQTFGSAVDWASAKVSIAPSVSKLIGAIQLDGGFTERELQWNDDVRLADDEASQWAAAYVLEGSAMGARYMVKAAEKMIESLPCQPTTPTTPISATYLQTLARDSYERWPKFIEALNNADCDKDRAVESATQVFVAAQEIFESLADELLQAHINAKPS